MSDVPYHLTYPMMHMMYLPPPPFLKRPMPVETLPSHNLVYGR